MLASASRAASRTVRHPRRPLPASCLLPPSSTTEEETGPCLLPGQRQQIRPMTVLSKKSAEDYARKNYSARQARTGRPVSPHVTIYSFPAAALTSIAIRVTGCALSVGALGLGTIELAMGSGSALGLMQELGSPEGWGGSAAAYGARTAVAFPVAYHYLGGLRHLLWDRAPEMLTNFDVDRASYALAGGSVLATLGLVLL